jgi:putative membrane protein
MSTVASPPAGSSPASSDRAFYVANALISAAAVALLGWILVLRQPEGDSSALAFMPAVNATMNGLAASFLVAGWLAIRNGKRDLHRALMLSAFGASAVFLVGYLVYHWVHGDTRYPADAPFRGLYLAVLASHVLLSIAVFPMILATFWFALRDRFATHRKLARWTLPIWLYVSVTGVAVFLMLRYAVG